MPMSGNPDDSAARPHVIVIHRWRDRYAHYEEYLDHAVHAVTYVTTDVGAQGVPASAAEVALVPATDDLAAVTEAVTGLVGRFGAPKAIVALKEDDLLIAARLRARWGLPGATTADLLPFRDKLEMCRRIARAGLPVPAFTPVSTDTDVVAFAERQGWPVVLKPLQGSSSAGVRLVRGPGDLAGVSWPKGTVLMAQAHVAHPIHHVDGLYRDGRLEIWRVSRYVNDCLGFRDGVPLGSVEVDDPAVVEAVGTWARRFLAALTDTATVFHLEVFVDTTENGAVTCTFLEIGARVGGAEIPFIWRDVHGYDLMEAAFALQLGEQPKKAEQRSTGVGGWLLVPAPAERPCRITHVTPLKGSVPGLYAESLLEPGEILPLADAYYEHVGGRFRFTGPTSAAVEQAIRTASARFRVAAQPCGEHRADPVPAGTHPNNTAGDPA
ncbi:ATP-grasp domain-containing protein [Streptomyces thermovulgaris]|uniref:ATP-grasp domain-containing protein n=1 Tax=Streptomyces thermovulgaris TaxID=1934 RepID=UPI001FED027E|nr:biotin carboxylase [Streptomyces thermovulgaris]